MKVTLTPEQFDRLGRLANAAELIRLQANQTIAAACAKRDAFYQTLVPRYQLPATYQSLAMNDETNEIEIVTAEEHT